uniref:Uncharacterized protein n=1 Tax=Mycena chlorophos TaxID=658473 RepID=A0ABQ0MBK7_MYCCL|nr:predicted protein [Mycena chlorophos]
MVFGLFSRKPQEPKPTPVQLRTPSPSVLSGSYPQAEERIAPITPPSTTPIDPASLRALIQSVPPQSFRAYTLNHLPTASPQQLLALSEFFSSLHVPPTLHCVRCHKGYFAVENNERSCLIGHDDESAEVEGVGSNVETLWNCCGKTVEGDGSEGPPEGWCFEGAHTTDLKRARFRADSTIHDDKLVSCARKRCHELPGSRKRTRRTTAARGGSDTDTDSDDDGASHSSIRTRSHAPKRARTVRESDTDIDEDVEMPLHSSPKSSASKRKPRAKSVVSNASTSAAKSKPKSSKPKSVVISSDLPTTPSRSKKPPSTRFLPVAASFQSTTSSAVSVDGSAGVQSQTQTVEVLVTKPVKAPTKRAMKPKQPKAKKLQEVVESSIAGET